MNLRGQLFFARGPGLDVFHNRFVETSNRSCLFELFLFRLHGIGRHTAVCWCRFRCGGCIFVSTGQWCCRVLRCRWVFIIGRRICRSRFCRGTVRGSRSEEHTSELQSRRNLVCRLLLEKKTRLNYSHARERGTHRSDTT